MLESMVLAVVLTPQLRIIILKEGKFIFGLGEVIGAPAIKKH